MLDGKESGVVGAEEGLLPVGLLEVALVHVGAAAGRHGLDLRHELVGHDLLRGDHLGPRRGVVPGGGELHVHGGGSPGGQHGVVDAGGLGVVGGAADGQDALGSQVLQDNLEGVVVVHQDATGDQPAAVLVILDGQVSVGQRAHVVAVVVEVRQLSVAREERNAELVEDGGKRSKKSVVDEVRRRVVHGDGVDDEDLVGEIVDHHRAVVNHGGEQGVELGDGLVEVLGSGRRGRELEGRAANGRFGMDLESSRDDDAVTGTAAAQSPEQIGVLGARGSDDRAGSSNNLEFQSLVGTESESSAERGMATTLGEATGDADGRAFASDSDIARAVSSFQELEALDAGTDGYGRAVVTSALVVDDVGALEVVGPDSQSASTSGTTEEADKGRRASVYYSE